MNKLRHTKQLLVPQNTTKPSNEFLKIVLPESTNFADHTDMYNLDLRVVVCVRTSRGHVGTKSPVL